MTNILKKSYDRAMALRNSKSPFVRFYIYTKHKNIRFLFIVIISLTIFGIRFVLFGKDASISPFMLMLIGPIITTLLWNLSGGFVSLILSTVLTISFLIPTYDFSNYTEAYVRTIVLYLIQGIVIIWLINKLNKANEKNAQLNTIKDEFISVASHELRTPLTSIKAYNQILEDLLKTQDKKKTLTVSRRMTFQINRLEQLINTLLDVSKIQTGKLDFVTEKFDLNVFVNEIVMDVQNLFPSHEIRIKSNAKNPLLISADKYRLSQVLTNILSNAVKYSPEAKQIVVKTFRERDSLQTKNVQKFAAVAVQDFGIGLREHDSEMIFEKFSRVDHDIKLGSAGLGLGLYIAAEIIKRHNGKIEVKTTKGKGSTFTIKVPLA